MMTIDGRLTSHARAVSITEAAALLAVSRAHVASLIATGLLPHRMRGARRCILLEDVLVYQHRRDAAHTVLDELARATDACGLYHQHGDASPWHRCERADSGRSPSPDSASTGGIGTSGQAPS